MTTIVLVGILIISITGVVNNENVNCRVVLTQQGPVRGYKNQYNGLFEFYGIPYASAPTGLNKFRAPLPAKLRPPLSIFEAVDRNITCIQGITRNFDIKTRNVQEDCLIANVFVPDTEEHNLPVLVYIFGGVFQFGYSNIKPVRNFAKEHNIIVVNFNYRLGTLGNLCLGTERVPGNAAMMDQIALLQWINNNIEYFGGDPNRVTLSGCSSGGASVDLLGLSKASEGLFRNMIVASGVAINDFAIDKNPIETALSNAVKKFKLPKANQTVESIEKVFTSFPSKQLINDDYIDTSPNELIFVPCVDKKILNDAPYNILKKHTYSQIPILYSYTQMEGSTKITVYERIIQRIKDFFSDVLPEDLKFPDKGEKETIAKLVQEYYFNDVTENNVSIAYMDYFSDILFIYGTLKTVELHVEAGHDKVYLLQFSYANEKSPTIPNTSLHRAQHCAQAQMVWDEDEQELTEEHRTAISTMREVWANFVKTGEPSPKGSKLPSWPPVSSVIGPVMTFDKKMELRTSLDESYFNMVNFWNNIYEKYYNTPQPPITP